MLEEKLMGIKKGLIAAGAAVILASCGGDECIEPKYNTQPVAGQSEQEINQSLAPGEYLVETAGDTYATASCPSGCSYDSGRGCCWCPD